MALFSLSKTNKNIYRVLYGDDEESCSLMSDCSVSLTKIGARKGWMLRNRIAIQVTHFFHYFPSPFAIGLFWVSLFMFKDTSMWKFICIFCILRTMKNSTKQTASQSQMGKSKDVLSSTDTFSNIFSLHGEYSKESRQMCEDGEHGVLSRSALASVDLLPTWNSLRMNTICHCSVRHLLVLLLQRTNNSTSQEEISCFVQPFAK